MTNVGLTEQTIALTWAEADAVVAHGLIYTGGSALDHDYGTRKGCRAAIRRLQLEDAIRDGLGWWNDDGPWVTDDPHPESFAVTSDGVDAIMELLPEMLADADEWLALCADPNNRGQPKSASELKDDVEWLRKYEAYREALLGIAARLGVDAVAVTA
jgi:hypothetical protein